MLRAVLVLAACAACGDNHILAVDASPPDSKRFEDAPIDAMYNPATLYDTGLCVDTACTMISPDAHPYTPQWGLWADGATKRRWYMLPPGTQIDTSDMDFWQFPVGTKFWKEFSAVDANGDTIKVETRLEQRIGPGTNTSDWFYAPYEWNAAQDDTMEVPMGVMNADNTMHDIPSRADCKGCHENLLPTRVLGFGALQLDTVTAVAGETNLASLVAAGTLTQNPTGATPPFFPMQATGDVAAALGYIHANCGHCHNANSPVHDETPMQLRMTVATVADTATTPAYVTAVGQTTPTMVNGDSLIIDPGMPDHSVMIDRFESTPGSTIHMPALGSKMIDPTGDTTLRTWITGL